MTKLTWGIMDWGFSDKYIARGKVVCVVRKSLFGKLWVYRGLEEKLLSYSFKDAMNI